MSAKADASSEPYLVPFGREQGGYLDLLGLPPDADDVAARAREAEFRKEVELNLRHRCIALKKSHDEGQLTKEELDEQTRQLIDAKTQRLTELNELKGKFDAIQAERRKLANEGRRDDSVNWLPMYPTFGADLAKWGDFLLRERPLGPQPVALLDEVERRWLDAAEPELLVPPDWARYLDVLGLPPDAAEAVVRARDTAFRQEVETTLQQQRQQLEDRHRKSEVGADDFVTALRQLAQTRKGRLAELDALKRGYQAVQQARRKRAEGARPFQHLPSARAPAGPIDLPTLAALAVERDLIALLTADALWGEIGHTNRACWSGKMAQWASELAALGPHLRLEPDVPGGGGPIPLKESGDPIPLQGENGPLPTNGQAVAAELPVLSRPTRRSIDRLEAEELGDFSRQPDRSRQQQQQAPPSLADLLAALGGGAQGSQPLDLDALRALLGRLGQPLPEAEE